MAKIALINREQKRRDTVKKFASKRAEFLAIIGNARASSESAFPLSSSFRALPRNASSDPAA